MQPLQPVAQPAAPHLDQTLTLCGATLALQATDTSFNVYLASLPPLLVIHPKRFAFDMNTFQTVKLNHSVSFPMALDMSPYTEEGIKVGVALLCSNTEQC